MQQALNLNSRFWSSTQLFTLACRKIQCICGVIWETGLMGE